MAKKNIFAVLLLGLLATASVHAGGMNGCLTFDAALVPGEAVDLELVDEMWLDPATGLDSIYRIDVEAAVAVTIELVTTWSEFEPDCRRANSAFATTTDAAIEWTSPGNDAIHVVNESSGTVSVRITMTKLASPPNGTVLTIPVVAHLPGKAGTFFRTDLRIYNPEPGLVPVQLVLMPSGSTSVETATVNVAPMKILRLDDVVSTIFGHDAVRGSLQLRMDSPYSAIRAISRTYNSTESGTFGQFIEAEPWNESAGSFLDQTRYITHLAKSGDFRSNVGFVEVIGRDANLDLELITAGGETTTGSLRVPAWNHLQINDIFEHLAVPPHPDATLVVRHTSESRVFGYGSIIDNHTSDPIFSRAVFPEFGANQLIIPAAASNPGAFGTHWRTDLRVVPGAGASSFTVTFYASDGSPPVSKGYFFPYGREVTVNDVVHDLGAAGTGALWIKTSSGRLTATSRTFNLTEHGTYGQFIPAESRFVPPAMTIIGVDGSADYRTNIGLFNPWDMNTVVLVTLSSDEGAMLGSMEISLGSRDHLQINDIFRALAVAPRMNCRIDLKGDPMGVNAYASVVDNRSGDAIYIPARKIRDFD